MPQPLLHPTNPGPRAEVQKPWAIGRLEQVPSASARACKSLLLTAAVIA